MEGPVASWTRRKTHIGKKSSAKQLETSCPRLRLLSFYLVHIQPARVNALSPSSVHLHRLESSICAAKMLRGARWVAEQPLDSARRAQPLQQSPPPCAPFTHRLPDGLILPPPSCLQFTFSPHLFQVSQKSVYESRNGPRSPASTAARTFDPDTERVCSERSISLDLSRSLMRDSRLLSDDYRGTRRANATGDPRLQINNSAVSLRLNQKCVKIKSLKLKGGRDVAAGRGGEADSVQTCYCLF